MNDDAKSASEDLAYMRALVDERGKGFKSGGSLYAAAGLIYGAQCLLTWPTVAGFITFSAFVSLIIGVLPTVLFLALLAYYLWRDRKQMQIKGTASRAIASAFAGAGLANISLVIVFATAAYQRHDFSIWLFYPVVVCALQGAVWYAIAQIQRRIWMGVVATGWLLTAVASGFLIPSPDQYLLLLGLALIALMAIPGYLMMQSAKGE